MTREEMRKAITEIVNKMDEDELEEVINAMYEYGSKDAEVDKKITKVFHKMIDR